MVKSDKVNRIRLGNDGVAKITSSNKERVRLLTAANEFVFNHTKSTMSREQKLKTVFKGLATQKTIAYKNIGSFKKNNSKWDEIYASYFLDKGYAESSGVHGWCRIEGKYYDPKWAWWGTNGNIYYGFAVPASRSGSNHSPNWARAAYYSRKVS
jgi:hypothetical protein